MRSVLAAAALTACVTPAVAQYRPPDWDYRADVSLPIADPAGPGTSRIDTTWQYSNWSKAEPGTRFPYPGSELQSYAPLGFVQAVTSGDILDPSFSATTVSPFSVQAEIRDRSGATAEMTFDGDITVTWTSSPNGDVRYAYASGNVTDLPSYHRRVALGDNTYDVAFGFGWGPWYAPGWDDRPGGTLQPDGSMEWTGIAGEFSLRVTETRNTPEPGTLALAGLGCGALAAWRVGRRKAADVTCSGSP